MSQNYLQTKRQNAEHKDEIYRKLVRQKSALAQETNLEECEKIQNYIAYLEEKLAR